MRHTEDFPMMAQTPFTTMAEMEEAPAVSLDECGYPPTFLLKLYQLTEQPTTSEQYALIMLSLDNLAMIVSGYGHAASERIVSELTDALSQAVPEAVFLQRIQRDQFGILLPVDDEPMAQGIAQKVQYAVQQFSCMSSYGELHILATAAEVVFTCQQSSAEEVMEKAYIRLHDHKHNALNPTETLLSDAEADRAQMGVAQYLTKAINQDRLQMAYQPIICAKTGEIKHYEALLRLVDDNGDITSAGTLIPVAERMGLIDVIDQQTLALVMEQLRAYPEVSIAFNVSNVTTASSAWLDAFHAEINKTPEIASRAIVEITETAVQRDLRRTAYFVASIQSTGAKVALDDFGSGYTSFRQLKGLSVDIVKIDGSFIKDLVDNADNRFFVKTLLDFTQGFGLETVAEYVESGDVAKMLMELGVDSLQGFYFGYPEQQAEWEKQFSKEV